ncbi:hypothetical protein DINM_022627 [Dirofilaria immitis]|nr:hypothetical protein [Dirofilaria immitis]
MREILQNILILILLLRVLNIESLTYIFRRANILEKAEYWENNIGPCENDRIRFDKGKITTALIGSDLYSQKIDLPDNGILFFGETMNLGKLGNWQCKKRQSEEEIYFKQSPSLAFHNGSNWKVLNDGIQWQPALHVLQVPSSQDTAIIPIDSGTRILLEDFITVNTLILAGQIANNRTFNDLLLQSVESQFQFELVPKLKSDRNINGINYQSPKFKNIVTIIGETTGKPIVGQFNSNLQAEKLALICSYKHCQSTDMKCRRTFRPIGHCCDICGSMLRFRTTIFNFNKFQKQVENYKRENQIVKEHDLDIAILRIDHIDDILPQYQIVVLAHEGAKRPFEERIYYGILKDLIELVQNNFGDFILILISLLAIGAIVIGIILAVRKLDFTNFRRLSNQPVYEAVHWRSTKAEDELELLRNDASTSNPITNDVKNSMKLESEYSSTFKNIAFDEKIIDDPKGK